MKCIMGLFVIIICSCNESSPIRSRHITSLAPLEKTFDFGVISKKDTLMHRFLFVNSGTTDLLIEKAESNCGCTTSAFSKGPVPPGDTGFIEARFIPLDTGFSRKSVVMLANTDSSFTVFYIQGYVKP